MITSPINLTSKFPFIAHRRIPFAMIEKSSTAMAFRSDFTPHNELRMISQERKKVKKKITLGMKLQNFDQLIIKKIS
jgi:hypothetical protein